MLRSLNIAAPPKTAVSKLMLSDRLIALAEDADRAGYIDTAEHLVTLACSVFDEAPKAPHDGDRAGTEPRPRATSH
jgi:hypothetical protein